MVRWLYNNAHNVDNKPSCPNTLSTVVIKWTVKHSRRLSMACLEQMGSLTQRMAGISWITCLHLVPGKIVSHLSKSDTYQSFDVGWFSHWNLLLNLYLFPIARFSLPKEERTFENEYTTHIFFPFRFVDYKRRSQLTDGHPDNIPLSEETPADRAKLDSLILFLKDRGGVLDRDMVTFTYMKEMHPSVDWRNVRLLASFVLSSD